MKWHKRMLAVAVALLPVYSYGTLEETIARIDGLLAEGKVVALLFIDMQTGFVGRFLEPVATQVMFEQGKLLDYFVQNKNVHFIDVNYEGEGPTISYLYQKLLKNQYYRLLVKNEDSAFDNMKNIPETGGAASRDEIKVALTDYLHSVNATEVVTTGCFDGGCLIQTAQDALEAGFNVTVDRDLNIIDDLYWTGPNPTEASRRGIRMAWEDLLDKHPNLVVMPDKPQTPCDAPLD